MRDGFDDVNETALPFIVNVVKEDTVDDGSYFNPTYNNNSSNFCDVCKRQHECKHCPMPVRHDLTLREYLAIKCDLKTFSGNANLYKHNL